MKNFSETVRGSADIIQVVSEYVTLKAAGHTFKGLCPFHSEKAPPFTVHREEQGLRCCGCKAEGDVVSGAMLAERVSSPEAVQIVAAECGSSIRRSGGDDARAERERQ